MKSRVGVDIGGTFTDLVLWNADGRHIAEKVLTTPSDPALCVLEGISTLLRRARLAIAEVDQIVHGTTLVTNAVIERKGARTALITTAGCRDLIEIGREIRFDIYDLFLEMPEPIAPRNLRYEVSERVSDEGTVLRPLDLLEVELLAERLRREGVEAVGVCLLFSYLNPIHERAIRDVLMRVAPELYVTISSELVPEIGEYERTTTTLLNAYVQPLVERYVRRLDGSLRQSGFGGQFLMMLSNGGTATPDTTCKYPVRLLESGPAAGALAAAQIGRAVNEPNLLSFDMGGTTAKACFILDGNPVFAHEFEAARVYRFKQGSGIPVRTPVIEMIEIGAGGGSIARIDSLGMLKVGPDSAGADPGPACYGKKGAQATVTDADLVLGYLDSRYFLGGTMPLDVDAARAALQPLAERLGVSVEDAAWGIHSVVNENMAIAARIHAAERGVDIRDFILTAFGGAGPVHAFRVARTLGISRMLLPFGAGVASAGGLLMAPIAFDFVQSKIVPLDRVNWNEIECLFQEMESRGNAVLGTAGVGQHEIRLRHLADIRYTGQGNEVSVILSHERGEFSAAAVKQAFEHEYVRLFGQTIPNVGLEIVNLRLMATGGTPELAMYDSEEETGRERGALKGKRPVYMPEAGGFLGCVVYERNALAVGSEITGPAIIEERESTAVLGSGSSIRVLPGGHLLVELSSVSPGTAGVIREDLQDATSNHTSKFVRTD